jgi:3-oxoadipate enol-lactonase
MPMLEVNNVKIYYEVKNKSGQETVAFFNGVAASVAGWALQVSVFEKLGYKIILHDFKGQLLSDKPKGPYTFSEHAAEAKALFDHLRAKKVHIIGTSYGGEVAMQFAIDYPDYAKTLAIVDSVSELDEILKMFVAQWKSLAQKKNVDDFFNALMPTVYSNSFMVKNKAYIEERKKTYNLIPQEFFAGQVALYETFATINMTGDLSKIKCPTLIICGQDDILKPVKFSKIIADQIVDAEFAIVPDCGHACLLEKPSVLNSLLLGFVAKNY